MSYIEELRDDNCTISDVSDDNYNSLLTAVQNFRNQKLDVWKTVTEDEYIEYNEKIPALNHVSFEEFKEMLKIDEGIDGKRKRIAIKEITNKALVKQLAVEMCYDETVLLPKTNNAYQDMENVNDKYYQYLWDLGYRGEEIEGIPKNVRGNFHLFQTKKIVQQQVKSILEIKSRLEYYLKQYQRNPSFYKKAEGIREAFEDYDIGMIRRFTGKTQSIDEEMRNIKQEKYEHFFDDTLTRRLARRSKKDYEYKEVEQILDDINSERVIPTEKIYSKLFEAEFDHFSSKGSQIAKSGSKEYSDLQLWREVRKHFMEQAYSLYIKALGVPKANEYLRSRYQDNDNPNPNTVMYTFLWEKNIKCREQKGKAVAKAEKNKLARMKEKEEKKLLHRLPDKMWKSQSDKEDGR